MAKVRVLRVVFLGLMVASTTSAQFKSQIPTQRHPYPSTRQNQESAIPLIDPERLIMNHSFSLSMASLGGQSFSYGIYSNRLLYLISDKWSLQTNLDLVQPTFSSLPNGVNAQNTQIYYGTRLQYRPSQNLEFTFSVNNYPRYRPYFGVNRYSPFLYSPE